MKSFITSLAITFTAALCIAEGLIVQTTPFTRTLLRATDAGTARSQLGVSTTAANITNQTLVTPTIIGGSVSPTSGTFTAWTNSYHFDSASTKFDVGLFGIKGDGVRLTGVSATAGSPTVTCTSANWKSSDVGKMVVLYTDATNITDLQTTILTVNSGTSITLADNSPVTLTSGILVYGTDNTVPLQTAIDALFSQGGGTLQFGNGIYMIGGVPVNRTPYERSVLTFPVGDTSQSTNAVTYVLRGVSPQYEQTFYRSTDVATNGTIFYCASTPIENAWDCVFGASGTSGGYSLSSLVFKNILFREPVDPKLSWINVRSGPALDVEACTFDVDHPPNYSGITAAIPWVNFYPIDTHYEPTNATAIIYPGSSDGNRCWAKNLTIFNYGCGIGAGECLVIDNCTETACGTAINFPGTPGMVGIEINRDQGELNSIFLGCSTNATASFSVNGSLVMGLDQTNLDTVVYDPNNRLIGNLLINQYTISANNPQPDYEALLPHCNLTVIGPYPGTYIAENGIFNSLIITNCPSGALNVNGNNWSQINLQSWGTNNSTWNFNTVNGYMVFGNRYSSGQIFLSVGGLAPGNSQATISTNGLSLPNSQNTLTFAGQSPFSSSGGWTGRLLVTNDDLYFCTARQTNDLSRQNWVFTITNAPTLNQVYTNTDQRGILTWEADELGNNALNCSLYVYTSGGGALIRRQNLVAAANAAPISLCASMPIDPGNVFFWTNNTSLPINITNVYLAQ